MAESETSISSTVPRRTVLVAEQRTLVRSFIGWFLMNTHLDVVGQSSTGDDVLRRMKYSPPDIVLINIDIPGPPISTVIRHIRYITARTRIVVLADESDKAHHRLRHSPCDGLVSWNSHPKKMIDELQSTDRCSSPSHLTDVYRPTPSVLSGRQLQVLELVSDGLSNREISVLLAIKEGTVKRHLANIFDRLGAHSRIEAINKSFASGLLSPRYAEDTS